MTKKLITKAVLGGAVLGALTLGRPAPADAHFSLSIGLPGFAVFAPVPCPPTVVYETRQPTTIRATTMSPLRDSSSSTITASDIASRGGGTVTTTTTEVRNPRACAVLSAQEVQG